MMGENKTLRVGLIQMRGGPDEAANFKQAEALIREAAGKGARLILTPEVTNRIAAAGSGVSAQARPEGEDGFLKASQALAAELGVWLLLGSLMLKAEDDPARAANRSILIDEFGEIRARYDKIHAFRADLPGGETYDEAKRVRPGARTVVAETPWGGLGMTVCYDLRFPHLYRRLAIGGARLLTIPAAFTVPTGKAHWHALLKARAIETGAFVLAPAQWGVHGGSDSGTLRASYGHSLAVGPWGEILADAGEGVSATVVDLDLSAVEEARRRIPAWSHEQPFA
ncbi:carbon-nitrogen hydrolase family protein [Neomegalonema sp.]|uniref:carbon-nitrogen hydrolase family protein n=1 Tax=Neomegalonema sp. TaxID=2039713 RepID=UPI0026234DFB|nr:carbon-nitrogen hydrolase family protein [Neomegalonema sp.]MDD2868668.1 carbon-nitrogen hydrolase family protein [Neomegalonema sp.]